MPGVNFDPNAGNNSNIKGNGMGVSSSNYGVISSRMKAEGPDGDTVSLSGTPKKESGIEALKRWVVGFIQPALGAKSSEINFLDKPVKRDDGSYVISKPFTSKDQSTASDAAVKLYDIQKGYIQRQTGELFTSVGAEKTEDGNYVAVARSMNELMGN